MELEYLDQHFYLKDEILFKSVGVSTSGSFMVNDLVKVFSISRESARDCVMDWLRLNGVTDYTKYFHKIEVTFSSETLDICFGVKSIESISTQTESVMVGKHRVVTRKDSPTIELYLTSNDITQEMNEFLFADIANVMDNKFNMTIVMMRDKPIVYNFYECFMSSFNTKVSAEYDDNVEYDESTLDVNLIIRTGYMNH